MFERKNQNILSEHYTKLVDHGDDDSEDDFITLKRADHDLDDSSALLESGFASKRKQKMSMSKKALAKYGEKGHKLVFDDEGHAHEVYEMKDTADVFKDEREIMEAGRLFAEAERGKMKEVDVVDKAEAKEKKREKKRKRKEREREVCCRHTSLHVRRAEQTHRARDTLRTVIWTAMWQARPWQSFRIMMGTSPQSSTCRQRKKGEEARARVRSRGLPRGHGRMRVRLRQLWRKRKSWRYRCCVPNGSLPTQYVHRSPDPSWDNSGTIPMTMPAALRTCGCRELLPVLRLACFAVPSYTTTTPPPSASYNCDSQS